METSKVIYETGATSHAVNDLILFTNNTRELVELRDTIYTRCINKWITHISMILELRLDLLRAAIKQYKKEFPTSHSHISNMTFGDRDEFVRLYANDFENWKQENNIKP